MVTFPLLTATCKHDQIKVKITTILTLTSSESLSCVHSHAHSHQSHVTLTTPTPFLFLPPSLSVLTHPLVRTRAHVLSARMQRAPETFRITHYTTCQKRTVHKSAAVFSQMLCLLIVLSQMKRMGLLQPMEVTDYQGALVSQAPPLSFCSSTLLFRTLLFCYAHNVNLLCRRWGFFPRTWLL